MLVIGLGKGWLCNVAKLFKKHKKLSSGYAWMREKGLPEEGIQLKSMMILCTNHQKHGSQSTLKHL